ncbi:MAG: winged helix DNA-binding domain-containing protein, partial [Ideonella sp.]|nr:winged helix DNA-binding domain-containing protein [Ideonella sp.]
DSRRVDGVDWYWPAGERIRQVEPPERVRLLAPFDPVVWDRPRFERFWGWAYRFEAYTPAAKRVRGHYALPLLWRERVIGWGNLAWRDGRLHAELGHVDGQAPREPAFRTALDEELGRLEAFLAPR